MRGTAIILVGGLVFGPTVVCAEPLFFDCHGTYERTSANEKPEYHRGPSDAVAQLMIDPDKGVVEGRGIGDFVGGTNEFCKRESDWMQAGATPLMRKIISKCTTLQISELAYSFSTTAVVRIQSHPSNPEWDVQLWVSGTLNRTTGEFSVVESDQHVDSDHARTEYKMTCVPTQRKF